MSRTGLKVSKKATWAEQSYCWEPKYCRTSVHRCGSPPRLTSPRRAHASMRPAWSPAAISTCNRAQASQLLLAGMDGHRNAHRALPRKPKHFLAPLCYTSRDNTPRLRLLGVYELFGFPSLQGCSATFLAM